LELEIKKVSVKENWEREVVVVG